MNILEYEDVEYVIVQCDSKEEARSLFEHLEEKGFKWGSGHLPTQWDGWCIIPDLHAYRIEMRNRRLICWDTNVVAAGSSITLSFKDFCRSTSEVYDDIKASDEFIRFLIGLNDK